MRCYITETCEFSFLSIVDPKSGIDYTQDMIGNQGAFLDGQFSWSEDLEAYVCTADTYEWWVDCLAQYQALDMRLARLTKEFGDVYEKLCELPYLSYNVDLIDLPDMIMADLDEIYGAEA